MRISSKTIFDVGVNQIGSLQNAVSKTQQQLSTGRRNLTAADDPIATARALEVTQSQSINTQLVTNRSNARSMLSLETVALASSTSILQDIKTLTVNAGNGGMTQKDRESLAVELKAGWPTCWAGQFLGWWRLCVLRLQIHHLAIHPPPPAPLPGRPGPARTAGGLDPQSPDHGFRRLGLRKQCDGQRHLRHHADPANHTRGGSGIISAGSVKDATLLTGHQYQIDFQVVPASRYAQGDHLHGDRPDPQPACAASAGAGRTPAVYQRPEYQLRRAAVRDQGRSGRSIISPSPRARASRCSPR
jgi:flagellar hook-associated protein 3 FlgL